MTEQELAGMIRNIKEIIRGVYDESARTNAVRSPRSARR